MPKEQDAKCTAAAQKDLFERRHEPVGEDQRSNTQVLLRRWCRRARSARRCMTSWKIYSRQRPRRSCSCEGTSPSARTSVRTRRCSCVAGVGGLGAHADA